MPGQNTQEFYDLRPLLPLIDAGYILLTPNFRLARRVKAAWDQLQLANGARVWQPIPVYPLESWLLQRWQAAVEMGLTPDRVTLGDGHALQLWQQVIEDEQRATGQYSLLQTAAAASLAAQARNTLLRWQVDPVDTRFASAFSMDEDCASWLAWQVRFEERLQANNMATSADCISQLRSCAQELPVVNVALLDFDDIPPLFLSCVQALCDRVETIAPSGPVAECKALSYPDKRVELAAIAAWARRTSEAQPGARIGIVLADMSSDRGTLEYLLRGEFDCLGENYGSLPVNFSTGITLDLAPVVRDAMRLLRLCLVTVEVDLIPGLLQSRFVGWQDGASPVAVKLLRMLFDSGKQRVDVADLRYLANQVKAGEQQGLQLGKCLQQVAAMRDLRDSKLPSRWLVPLCDVLDSWGWPGRGPLDSLEHQQVQQWYGVLEELASYDDVCGPVSLEGALGLLQTILGRQISQPQTADTAIQVLGSLEAAGLVFDYLWLSGMQASRWPAAARPNPFIPLALQRDLQMPHATAEREWAFAQGLMQQYQRSAGTLYASYARQADAVAELPSALLKGFALEQCGDADQVHPRWTNAWRNRALEVVEYSPAPALAGAERAGIGGGSALLEDQSQCPFRAFARRRLLAEPLGEPVTGVSAAQRGSLLHQALHCLFGLVPDSDFLQQLSEEAESDLVTTAVQVALDELPRSGLQATTAGWRELEGVRLHDLLRQWLDVERQRSAFVVASREEDFTLELETLELRLRVDRIDHLPDGSAVIIDYKSGRCSLQDWLGERPASPQLLLYGIAAQAVPAALSFAQLRPDECTFVGAGQADIAPGIKSDMAKLVRGGWDIDSWEALNARWRGQLQALATEFVNGDARVEPQAKACTWCGLQGLCRVGMEQVVTP